MRGHSSEVLYSEYMSHARHIEAQRQVFATVFTAVFGGLIVLAGSASAEATSNYDLVFFFLIVFSIFGFCITSVWNASFVKFTRLAERIAIEEFETPLQYQRFSKHRKLLSAARIFIAFYSLMVGLSSTMLIGDMFKHIHNGMLLGGITLLMLCTYLLWVERRVRTIDRLHRQFAIDLNGRK